MRILGYMGVDLRDMSPSRHDGEDWLGTQSEFAWIDEEGETPQQPERKADRPRRAPRADRKREETQSYEPEHPDEAIFRRRRTIGLVVALAILGGVIVVAVIAFGGSSEPTTGGAAAGTTAATTPNEQPATTANTPTTPSTPTTTASTPTTTPTTPAVDAQTIDLPAGEKLEAGATGDTVTQLQNGLVALGFDPGTVDGDFGPSTEAAVTQFQTANGLTADGVVGAQTVQALNTALADAANNG
jgi:Putative peptidoglycan binding domain